VKLSTLYVSNSAYSTFKSETTDPSDAVTVVSDAVGSLIATDKTAPENLPIHTYGAYVLFQTYHWFLGSYSSDNPYGNFTNLPWLQKFVDNVGFTEVGKILDNVQEVVRQNSAAQTEFRKHRCRHFL
jgi:hypothetical protein